MSSFRLLLCAVIGSLLFLNAGAKDLPAKSGRLVNDYAGVLSDAEKSALESKLVAYYDSTSTQIAIVIEKSLEGDDLFDYSQRLATAWGIGEKGKNNGILIYAAIADRKLRIHTGYGMEATITDALTTRIRTEYMNPYFKQGDYYRGLDEGTTIIMQAAAGEYVNENPGRARRKDDISIGQVLILLFVMIVLAFVFRNRGGRGGRRSGGWGGPVFWGTFGSGGFSGGGRSSGGGGFGGFGGGGFGGGGSGGSW
jgi:uncharacterized protein